MTNLKNWNEEIDNFKGKIIKNWQESKVKREELICEIIGRTTDELGDIWRKLIGLGFEEPTDHCTLNIDTHLKKDRSKICYFAKWDMFLGKEKSLILSVFLVGEEQDNPLLEFPTHFRLEMKRWKWIDFSAGLSKTDLICLFKSWLNEVKDRISRKDLKELKFKLKLVIPTVAD